jgi:peptidyl-prolyl cis-trans isomerase SurA
MKQAADVAGIEVSEQEVDNAVEDIKMQNNITDEELLNELERNGLTYKEYREQLREDIRQVKFVSREFRAKIAIEHEEMKDYYKRNIESFRGQDSFRMSLLFLARTDEKTMRARLDAVMDELEEGVDFKHVASEYSDGPTPTEGGDLGYVMAGELDSAVAGAARQLKPGEVSGPIFTRTGINVIQLIDKREGEVKPFEEVADQIRDLIFKEKMEARYGLWLEDTKKIAHIEVRL